MDQPIGEPELVRPRIHSLTLDQNLYYGDEPSVRLRFALGGRIDARQHRLKVSLVLEDGRAAAASAELPALAGRHARSLPRGTQEGRYTLKASLVEAGGRVLDTEAAPVYVIAVPYAATEPRAE